MVVYGIRSEDRLGVIPPLSFIDVKGNESIENSSFKNPEEANELMNIVER